MIYIAEKATNYVQNMNCFWLFCLYGLLPLLSIFHPYQDTFLYFSNFLQLIFLPLLACGQLVSNKASEKRTIKLNKVSESRNTEMYNMLKEEFQIIKDKQAIDQEERQELKELVQKTTEILADMQEVLNK